MWSRRVAHCFFAEAPIEEKVWKFYLNPVGRAVGRLAAASKWIDSLAHRGGHCKKAVASLATSACERTFVATLVLLFVRRVANSDMQHSAKRGHILTSAVSVISGVRTNTHLAALRSAIDSGPCSTDMWKPAMDYPDAASCVRAADTCKTCGMPASSAKGSCTLFLFEISFLREATASCENRADELCDEQ